ncbi:isopenicillin N synthase family dioxygenase [Aliidiomarina maris]|uniref:2-oxoglutarate-dependent ethylene/succinate-forming enzyme n=1 Tax=Aliidiomarina maris TaxID=531312 RepID=A0A327WSX6_9GAMM|nr:2-oxoglutarate and iron-dependent oxygenase domain-containing protein [Aliidiomarina maris]MBA3987832.1 2-oxobutyrate oxidase [Idiomarina sp.]RAJ95217.1 isopenicillin N synthase-like dioxygenase [Aliidiomarina maris]RUO21085.1 2-oxobutyrate oxidase [Aliidiomarina maris]
MQAPALPVLDLQQLAAGGEQKQAFLTQLAEAARTVGFFYVTGHQLGQLQQAVMQQTRAFFALPEADKQRLDMVNSPHFRGYTQLQGELTQGKPDLREQFDLMNEETATVLADGEPQWWKLIGPNQWPTQLPQFKAVISAYQAELTQLTVTLLRAFADVLEQPADIFDDGITPPYTHMKLIRYPGSHDKAQQQGVGAHKDPGYLTIVTQDQQSGLEVLTDDRGWVSAPPIEGAVVVNIGELLELASDGYLRATYHRVTSPAGELERYSCAFFMAAKLNSEVPLLQLPAQLKAQALGPSADPNNPMFYQVGENVLKGRLRSHPNVAQVHYHGFCQAC